MGGSGMREGSFDRFAGWLSILAGVTGIGYALAVRRAEGRYG